MLRKLPELWATKRRGGVTVTAARRPTEPLAKETRVRVRVGINIGRIYAHGRSSFTTLGVCVRVRPTAKGAQGTRFIRLLQDARIVKYHQRVQSPTVARKQRFHAPVLADHHTGSSQRPHPHPHQSFVFT